MATMPLQDRLNFLGEKMWRLAEEDGISAKDLKSAREHLSVLEDAMFSRGELYLILTVLEEKQSQTAVESERLGVLVEKFHRLWESVGKEVKKESDRE